MQEVNEQWRESRKVLNCRTLNSLCLLFIVQLQNKNQLEQLDPLTELYLNLLQERLSCVCECSSFKQMFFISLLVKTSYVTNHHLQGLNYKTALKLYFIMKMI